MAPGAVRDEPVQWLRDRAAAPGQDRHSAPAPDRRHDHRPGLDGSSGVAFGAVAVANDVALRDRATERVALRADDGEWRAAPRAMRPLAAGPTARLHLHMSATVDLRPVGSLELTGVRVGRDFRWLGYVGHGPPARSVRCRRGSTARRGRSRPGRAGTPVDAAAVDADSVDRPGARGRTHPGPIARRPRTAASRSSRAPGLVAVGSPSTARSSGGVPAGRLAGRRCRSPPLARASSTTGSSSTASSARSPAASTARRGDRPGGAQRHRRGPPDGHGAGSRLGHLSSEPMTLDDDRGRYATKRDRLARLTRLVSILQAHPEGMRTADIATRVGMSVRTVYRDLTALQDELRLPVWGDEGVWGIDDEKAFLPPLKLTQGEAMAVVLAGAADGPLRRQVRPGPRGRVREARARPAAHPLAEHVERTLDGLSKAPRDERFSTNVRLLTKAWAERRVVTIDYTPANYEPGATPRRATVRPYLLEPSLQTHALYLIGFDEERGADPHVQDRADRDRRADAAHVRAARPGGDDLGAPGGLGHHRRPATGRGRAALRAGRGEPRARGDLASDPVARDRSRRLAALAGHGLGHDRDPALDPAVGRRRRGHRAGVACAMTWPTRIAAPSRATADAPPPVRGGQLHQRPDPRVRRADQTPDEPTNRRSPGSPTRMSPRRTCSTPPGSSACAGSASSRVPAGSSRPPSTRASPTAWASCTRPASGPGRSTRACGRRSSAVGEPLPSEGLVVETMRMAGLLHDVGHGPFAHFFDDHVLAAFPAPADARRPAGKRLTHEDLSQLIIEGELGPLLRGLRRAPGAVAERDGFADRRVDRPGVGLVPRLQAGPGRCRRCRAGCAGSSRCCRASSRSTTSTTSGATRT